MVRYVLQPTVRNAWATLLRTKDRTMSVHTGLSTTVGGYCVSVERDNDRRIATVVARPLDDVTPTKQSFDAVSVAVELLQTRAQRFLGLNWTVKIGWKRPNLTAFV